MGEARPGSGAGAGSEFEFVAVDATNLDDIPDPALPGSSCRTCDYWETLDGHRAARTGDAARTADGARALKLRRLTAASRLGGSYGMLAYRTDAHGTRDAVGYAQFGPISAYPRAQAIRDRYHALPESPPPYVVTCLQVRPELAERREETARALLRAVCDELDRRGVVAVEAFPERVRDAWAPSPGPAAIYEASGFTVAAYDERYPVYRVELSGEAGEPAWPADLLRPAGADDDAWPLPLPKKPDPDAWVLPQRPKMRNPFGEDD